MKLKGLWLVVAASLMLQACSKGETSPQSQVDPAAEKLANELEAQRLAAEQQKIQEDNWRTAISRVLAADAAVQKTSDQAIYSQQSAIDMSGTPSDFAAAYYSNTKAWEKAAQVQSAIAKLKSDDSMGPAVIGGILATALGSDQTPFSDQIRAIQQLEDYRKGEVNELISSSWQEVEKSAISHGVTPAR